MQIKQLPIAANMGVSGTSVRSSRGIKQHRYQLRVRVIEAESETLRSKVIYTPS